ncbi:DgyrCDS10283 [Dimorphilus gyrociliatus]|uniref:DgyrCDS10283 n=1 Tax=Dimorphilus gyrociliatus TaxID=2664684 RepID=A0A7I8W4V3_9ANNE|nr:DgyrCDS10283 [Dimorphilus gyrociliatus]
MVDDISKHSTSVERSIKRLLKANKAHRKQIAQQLMGQDEKIIAAIFSSEDKSDRKELMLLRNKPLEYVATYLDNKAFHFQKELDKLRYERKKIEKKIKRTREQLLIYDHWLNRRMDRKGKEKTIRIFENQFEKVRLKTETAESIGNKYEQVIGCLQEDFHTMPKRLERLEKSLREYKIEARQMLETKVKALRLRNEAKDELNKLEKVTFEERQEKENELLLTKTDMENRRKEAQEIRDKRILKSSPAFGNDLNTDRSDIKRREMQDLKEKLENYETTIRQLQNSTRVTDLQKVVERIIIQKEVTKLLERQKEDAERQRNYYLSLRDDALEQLMEARYSTEVGMTDWRDSVEKMQVYVKNAKSSLKERKTELGKQAKILQTVRKGVISILERTNATPTLMRKSTHDLAESLKQCCRKLRTMQTFIDHYSNSSDCQKQFETGEFYDFIKKTLPDKNIQSSTTKSPFMDDFYESEDNEDVLTREDVKTVTTDILNSLMNKKKGNKSTKKHYQQAIRRSKEWRLIDYYEISYKDINFDGIFGLRVLEGGLKLQVLNYAKGDIEISEKNLAIIKELSEKAEKLSTLAINVLKTAKDKSYERLSPLIKTEWKGFGDHKELDFNLLWPDNFPEFANNCDKKLYTK